VVFRISVGRFELEVLRADGGAAAGGLLAGARPSGYRVTRRWTAASPVEQRIVHWILDELRDLLRDRLDVGVSDHRRRNSDIGGEDERVVGGGVDRAYPRNSRLWRLRGRNRPCCESPQARAGCPVWGLGGTVRAESIRGQRWQASGRISRR